MNIYEANLPQSEADVNRSEPVARNLLQTRAPTSATSSGPDSQSVGPDLSRYLEPYFLPPEPFQTLFTRQNEQAAAPANDSRPLRSVESEYQQLYAPLPLSAGLGRPQAAALEWALSHGPWRQRDDNPMAAAASATVTGQDRPLISVSPGRGQSMLSTAKDNGIEDRGTMMNPSSDGAAMPQGRRKPHDSATSSRSIRRRNGRKKCTPYDQRWSKRFVWPEQYHRSFVSAIFDVGLREASPAKILEILSGRIGDAGRVRTLLQRYRDHDAGVKENVTRPVAALGLDSIQEMVGLEEAASDQPVVQDESLDEEHVSPTETEKLTLPTLTRAERASDTGVAMGHLAALFLTLRRQLKAQRAMKRKLKDFDPPIPAPVSLTESTSFLGQPTDKKATILPLSTKHETTEMISDLQGRLKVQQEMRSIMKNEIEKFTAGSVPASKGSGGNQRVVPPKYTSKRNYDDDDDDDDDSSDASSRESFTTLLRDRKRARTGSIESDVSSLSIDMTDEKFFEFLAKS